MPINIDEIKNLGWSELDVIIVTGDAYIDVPSSGTALIGKLLVSKGFKVGVISQPGLESSKDILRLGEPRLFWGVNSGCVDSMVANYTAVGKPRKSCDFTPGGVNDKRPDRAVIVYSNLIKRYSKKPILLGGIEASLRRIAHYDFKTDKVRKSILFDAKADAISYGNGERSVLEFANALKNGSDWETISGLCYIAKSLPEDVIELPSFEEVSGSKEAFHKMFKIFNENADPINARPLGQKTLDRYLIQNKPSGLDSDFLDEVSELDYERDSHNINSGEVRALDTVRFSIMSHRGCFGSCSFCAISVHQGRKVVSRSIGSILREIDTIKKHKKFKGIISDIGGATGNMYKMGCAKMDKLGACKDKHCLFPNVCPSLNISHKAIIELLNEASKKGIKKIFASSGIRYDIIEADKEYGEEYLKLLIDRHISGQLKLAPESADPSTLKIMKKPSIDILKDFLQSYDRISKKLNREAFVSCYFIAAHPGIGFEAAHKTRQFALKYLKFNPEQVQIFTPTPSTWSTCMYYTGLDEAGNVISVERGQKNKEAQKDIIMGKYSGR